MGRDDASPGPSPEAVPKAEGGGVRPRVGFIELSDSAKEVPRSSSSQSVDGLGRSSGSRCRTPAFRHDDDESAEERALVEALRAHLTAPRRDPKSCFFTRAELRGYCLASIARELRAALVAGGTRERWRYLAGGHFDAALFGALTDQRLVWYPGRLMTPSKSRVTLGADDVIPLKHNVWAYVLLGGALDVASVAAAIEADAALFAEASEMEIMVYATHLLIASKVARQLEDWDLPAAPTTGWSAPSTPEALAVPEKVSSSLRIRAGNVLALSPKQTARPRPAPGPSRGRRCLAAVARCFRRPAAADRRATPATTTPPATRRGF